MALRFQRVRGMRDILPDETPQWQRLEGIIRDLMQRFGYAELRTPIIEDTALFRRSIGEVTDIVEKEMYTFEDLSGGSLTLRPENTAALVRACLEAGLLRGGAQRLFYMGPMFRYEKPQRGRYRQFHQLGVEAYGMSGALIELELIQLSAMLWQVLGLGDDIRLEINTLGSLTDRQRHRDEVVAYFRAHADELDADSVRRLEKNPLRILDSKNPAMQTLIEAAPKLLDYLSEDSSAHFERLKALLDEVGIAYTINPRLVRGLDYYGHTVFEWVTDRLGAQGTVCGGGRYDAMIDELGGQPTPAVGWALGIERLLELVREVHGPVVAPAPELYVVMVGEQAEALGLRLSNQLRQQLASLRVLTHCGGGSFKAQFKKADASGAQWALVIGDSEAESGVVQLKPLRGDGEQQSVPVADVAAVLAGLFH